MDIFYFLSWTLFCILFGLKWLGFFDKGQDETRREYAKYAMQGMVSATTTMSDGIPYEELAKISFEIADAMIKEECNEKG